ncbi:Alcohol dehydrogenase superfamily, zinc-type [Trema orientale]|uniref:Alcohol dehydrogenase superfamily, zinc-type n=1 Tax=Trema orientale TaxID=63057 RepID=A0A2P5FBP5_TREOI|nr:Alcohol dehydrogenase superfamily, zinc-type [Trema orientale]
MDDPVDSFRILIIYSQSFTPQAPSRVDMVEAIRDHGLGGLEVSPSSPVLSFYISTEACGVVTALSPGLISKHVRDLIVYAGTPMGSYAGEQILAADKVAPFLDSVGTVIAVSFMLKGMTAQFLVEVHYLSLSDPEVPQNVSNGTSEPLDAAIPKLRVVKIQRMRRVEAEVFQLERVHYQNGPFNLSNVTQLLWRNSFISPYIWMAQMQQRCGYRTEYGCCAACVIRDHLGQLVAISAYRNAATDPLFVLKMDGAMLFSFRVRLSSVG